MRTIMSAYVVFTRTKTIDQKELEKYWTGIQATIKGHPIEVLRLWHAGAGAMPDLIRSFAASTLYQHDLTQAFDRSAGYPFRGKRLTS